MATALFPEIPITAWETMWRARLPTPRGLVPDRCSVRIDTLQLWDGARVTVSAGGRYAMSDISGQEMASARGASRSDLVVDAVGRAMDHLIRELASGPLPPGVRGLSSVDAVYDEADRMRRYASLELGIPNSIAPIQQLPRTTGRAAAVPAPAPVKVAEPFPAPLGERHELLELRENPEPARTTALPAPRLPDRLVRREPEPEPTRAELLELV